MTAPFAFRDRALVLAVFDYVAEVDEGPPVGWTELITVLGTDAGRPLKTIENATYELVRFGALHRIGQAPRRGRGSTGRDTRALVATPLGRAWRDGHVPGLPGEPDDPIEAADAIGHELEEDQAGQLHQSLIRDVTKTIGDPT